MSETQPTRDRCDYRTMTNEALIEEVRYRLNPANAMELATVLAERIEDGEHDYDDSNETEEPTLPVHPGISLLVSRMETHPKEFWLNTYSPTGNPTRNNNNAMLQAVEPTKGLWHRREKELFNRALRAVRLQEMHERLMGLILKSKQGELS